MVTRLLNSIRMANLSRLPHSQAIELIGFKYGRIRGRLRPEIAPVIARWFLGQVDSVYLKENRARGIWRLPGIYIKQFKHPGFWQNLRLLFRSSKARSEYRALVSLHKRGLPVPIPLGFMEEKGPLSFQTSYLITEELKDAIPLRELFLRSQVAPGIRFKILEELAGLVVRMHRARLCHPDLHLGNILIQFADKGPRLYIMDLHRFKTGRLLGPRRISTLGFIWLSMYGVLSSADRVRFLRYYAQKAGERFCPALVRRVHKSFLIQRERHYRSRAKRCWVTSSKFEVDKGVCRRRDARGIVFPSVSALEREGELIKGRRGGALFRWQERYFVKVFSSQGLKRLLESFLWGPAERIWYNAHALGLRGVPTPSLYAFRRGTESMLIGQWIQQSLSCYHYVIGPLASEGTSGLRRFIEGLAIFVRGLHEKGVYHKDLKATNLLIQQDAQGARFYLLDIDRVSFKVKLSKRSRLYNIAQLNASVPGGVISRTDRLRFLRTYMGGIRYSKDDLRRIIKWSIARSHFWPVGAVKSGLGDYI
jgi:tRNA A-37 threonylcarbamoyl transferase component Bud32